MATLRKGLLAHAVGFGLVWGTVQAVVLLNTDTPIDVVTGIFAGLWLALIVELLRVEIAKHKRIEAADAKE